MAEAEERLVEDGDSCQPDVVSSESVSDLSRGGHDVVSVEEGESEEDAEERPDDVSGEHHPSVSDQVVSVLVAPEHEN